MPDPSGLTDDDLRAALLRHGFKPGPIVGEVELSPCHLLFTPIIKKLTTIVYFGYASLHQGFV